MNSVTTRSARAEDIDTIVELWKDLMDFHQERDRHFTRSPTGPSIFAKFVADQLAKEDSLVLVAEEEGGIVAYCLAITETHSLVFAKPRHAEIIDLFVSQSHRQRGIGERLMREVEHWFSQQGIARIEARVAVRNEVSTQFWRKIGYEPYTETVFREP
jgi:GNAT superfamily N-acetyltransferase